MRAAQGILLRGVTSTAPRWPEVSLIRPRSILDVFPQWPPWKARGYLVDVRTGNKRWIEPPWPYDVGRSNLLAAMAGAGEFLRWAIGAGAELWVPTLPELAEAEEQLDEALTAPAQPATRSTVTVETAPDPEYVDPATVPPKRRQPLNVRR